MNQTELKLVLELHKKWLLNEDGGKRANLSYANLRGVNLRDSNLSYADLSGANLRDVDLRGANLRDANLRDANLSYADLSGADLRGVDLRDANLIDANLRDANLSYANLSYANLRDANLSYADLSGAKEDLFNVLDSAPNEAPGVLEALRTGRVNGSTYSDECACLVGTIANIRKCNYRELGAIKPNSGRPAERLFLAIRKGDRPDNHPIAKIVAEWIEEWKVRQVAAPYKNS